MAVKVRQCCCGCSLRTGTIAIAILTLLGSLYGLYTDGRTLLVGLKLDKNIPLNEETREMLYRVAHYTALIQLPVLISSVIMAWVLLLGVEHKVPCFIRMWVIFSISGTFLSVIINLVGIYFMFVYMSTVTGWIVLAGLTFSVSLGAYLIIVVHSYYLQLLESDLEKPS